jgi:DNA-binding SARP family transcriptional activator
MRPLESGKVSGILAVLLLTPGKIVSADDLIDRLWETDPPAGARGYLSVYVSRLRASLRRAGGDTAALSGRASGYSLVVDPGDVDLHQFRRLRLQAATAAKAGESSEAVRLLRDADLLWHGPALAGSSGHWFAAMRSSLQEERRAAVIKRVELGLDLGRHVSLVGEIAGLLAQYPMDETLIGCQMTALYRCGRTSEALSMYRETYNGLVEDQGTEPGSALMDLHQRILCQDPGLSALPTQVTPVVDSPSGKRLTAFLNPASSAQARFRASCLAPDQPAHLGPADPPVGSTASPAVAGKAYAIPAQSDRPSCRDIVMSVRQKGIPL